MNDADEYVVLVDDEDRHIGVAPKLKAHIEGLRHRAVSVLVVNSNGELLLQRRHSSKYHSGGLWSNACCSHPRPGEAVELAATRRLMEEMGIVCDLRPVFATTYCAPVVGGLIENEYVHVYGGVHDGEVKANATEVDAIQWRAPSMIARDIASWPERYTVWFAKYLREFMPAVEKLASR
jgi:isopentenyl-diphosphate delta-isomerase